MEHIMHPPRPNRLLIIAGSLMTLTTFVHVFAGGPEIYDPLRAGPLDPVVRSVTSVIWHAITAILAIMAVGLFWVSCYRNRPFEMAMIAIQLSFALLFIVYGMADLRELTSMPQWSIFLVGAGLILMAGGERAD